MADRKITDLTALAAGSQATGDLLTIVDVSEGAAADKNKKITVESLFKGIPGNVGVGTSAPNSPGSYAKTLEVSDGDSASIVLSRTNSTAHSLELGAFSGASLIESTGATVLRFKTNSSEQMRIDSSGRLLVGTSSASVNNLLQIEGDVADVQNPGGIFLRRGLTSAEIGSVVGRDLGIVNFGTKNGDVGAQIFAESDATMSTGDSPGRLVFGTTADGASTPTERMRIDSSGRLGIGETSPADLLHIKSASGNANVRLTTGNTSSGYTGVIFGDTSDTNTGAVQYDHSNDSLQFEVNNSERMRILSSGGLTFNGDTAAANALDDYEEGNWTPAITFGDSSTGIAHSAQAGKYTKIGRVVLFQGYVQLSNKGSATGILKIGGLPYTSLNASTAYSTTSLRVNNSPSGSEIPAGYVNVNDTRIVVNRQLTNGTGTANWTEAHTNNTTDFILNGHYIV